MQSMKFPVTLPNTLVKKAREKAEYEYGFKLPELIRYLLANYINEDAEISPVMERIYKYEADEVVKKGENYSNAEEFFNSIK